MLLDVLGLVGDHADERVQLDDCHAQVDQVDAVAQQGAERWEKVCGGTEFRPYLSETDNTLYSKVSLQQLPTTCI